MVWAYSFVLKSSQDEAAFLEENREALEELGYSVSFVENHSENFWASVTPMRQSATFSAAVFAGVLLLGLVLLVPALEPLFAVAPLSIGMVGAIVGLAFGSMVVIQLLKLLRR